MNRTIHRLTKKDLARTEPGRYADGGNLVLCITSSEDGKKTYRQWLFRYTLAGRNRCAGLGSLNTYSLTEVREIARRCRQLLAEGVDIVEHRRRQRRQTIVAQQHNSFAEVARLWHPLQSKRFKQRRHLDEIMRRLERYVFPVIGTVPIDQITRGKVADVFVPHWVEKHPSMATLRAYVSEIFSYAQAKGLIPEAAANPALLETLKPLLPTINKAERKAEHFKALPWRDLPAFWARLAKEEGMAAACLRFLILTAVRSREAAEATWGEIDIDQAIWTLSPARMKNGSAHVVTLSTAAIAALPQRTRNRYLFWGKRTGVAMSDGHMRKLLIAMGADATVHGFRSCFKQWADDNGLDHRVSEAALAHVNGGAVEQAYARSTMIDRRRQMLEEWAAFVTTAPAKAKVARYRPTTLSTAASATA